MHVYGNESDSPERLLWPGDVAALLRVDARTVGRWAKSGRLPCITTPGGHRRYRESDITALLAKAPTDFDSVLAKAREVVDLVTIDWRDEDGKDADVVTVLAWKDGVCEYASAASPSEALSAAVAKLSALLNGGAR